jgi:CRP-like cAMP-binding protein
MPGAIVEILSGGHSPRENRLLAALPLEDYGRLLPHLEFVSLRMGEPIHGPGERENYLYFLTSGIVSKFYTTESGARAGFAVTGREGVVGVATFLGGVSSPSYSVVTSSGYAYRLKTDVLIDAFDNDVPLRRLLLRYTQALIAQTSQMVVCNRLHSLEQQLCRWLLLCLDRLPSNDLTMTQELIANMLGVRREGVTEAAGHLQAAGLIQYRRGQITVLDRAKLEQRVCECYSAVKLEYSRLLPEMATG